MKNEAVLIGLAIDLSGSMQQSVRNDIDEQRSKMESVRQSFEGFVKEARRSIEQNRQEGKENIIKVFAYGFGLQLPQMDVGDLLTISKVVRMTASENSGTQETINTHDVPKDGYKEFEKIASAYGYEPRLVQFAKRHLGSADAGKLAQELSNDREAAEELTHLIPKTQLRAMAKYGLTKGVNFVLGQGAVRDDFEEAERLALKLIAHANKSSVECTRDRILNENKTRIVNRVNEIKDTTLLIEELADVWDDYQSSGENHDNIKEIMYGNTPMQKAFKIINERFEREWRTQRYIRSFLFILSDGEPTDSSPFMLANNLKEAGVTIISCFVTDKDITEPRVLFAAKDVNWTEGAALMFDIASECEETSEITQFLMERKWKIHHSAKLFAQVNHTEILEEFLEGLLKVIKAMPDQNSSSRAFMN